MDGLPPDVDPLLDAPATYEPAIGIGVFRTRPATATSSTRSSGRKIAPSPECGPGSANPL